MTENRTKVTFCIDGEGEPKSIFISISPEKVTLGDFKKAIKPPLSDFAYYSKTENSSAVDTCSVEISRDDTRLPSFNGKIVLSLTSKNSSTAGTSCSQEVTYAISENRKSGNGDVIEPSLFPSSINYLVKKVSKGEDIRRLAYIHWSNTEKLKDVFNSTMKDITHFFKYQCLELEGDGNDLPNSDILEVFFSHNFKLKPKDVCSIRSELMVDAKDFPLSANIPISSRLLGQHRNVSSSKINRIGLQHVVMSNLAVDSSASSTQDTDSEKESTTGNDSTSVSENNSSTSPSAKRKKTSDSCYSDRKICQIATNLNYDNEMLAHVENSTKIEPTLKGVWVDILILIKNENICRSLAKYLGLIFLEDALADEVKEPTLSNMLQIKFQNPAAKSYRLLQNVIARKLMFARSNISVTSNLLLFSNVNATTKGVIFLETEKNKDKNISYSIPYANVSISFTEPVHILKYIDAITEIVNHNLNVKSNISALFYSRKENKYFEIPFPLYSVIPLYILRFFSQVLMKDPKNCKFSFDAIE